MAAQVVEIADTIREGKKVRTSSRDGSLVDRSQPHGGAAAPGGRRGLDPPSVPFAECLRENSDQEVIVKPAVPRAGSFLFANGHDGRPSSQRQRLRHRLRRTA